MRCRVVGRHSVGEAGSAMMSELKRLRALFAQVGLLRRSRRDVFAVPVAAELSRSHTSTSTRLQTSSSPQSDSLAAAFSSTIIASAVTFPRPIPISICSSSSTFLSFLPAARTSALLRIRIAAEFGAIMAAALRFLLAQYSAVRDYRAQRWSLLDVALWTIGTAAIQGECCFRGTSAAARSDSLCD